MSNIYKFTWGSDQDEMFLTEIDEHSPKKVEKLLQEYKESDPEYNERGWIEFLNKKGIMARHLNEEVTFNF